MGGGNAAHSRAAILARPVPKATTLGSYAAARTHVPVGAASDVSTDPLDPAAELAKLARAIWRADHDGADVPDD